MELHVNAPGKGMSPSILLLPHQLWVNIRADGFFSHGESNSLGGEKLNSRPVLFLL